MVLVGLLSRLHGLSVCVCLAGALLLLPELLRLATTLRAEGLIVAENVGGAVDLGLFGTVDLGPIGSTYRLNPAVLSLLRLDDREEWLGVVLLAVGGGSAALTLLVASVGFSFFSVVSLPYFCVAAVASVVRRVRGSSEAPVPAATRGLAGLEARAEGGKKVRSTRLHIPVYSGCSQLLSHTRCFGAD
jgi:hypothetical protein